MGNLNSQFRVLELHLAIMADGDSRGVPFCNRDRQTILARGKSEGSSFVYVTLPKLGRAIDEGLVRGTFNCPIGFALSSDTRLPKFLNAVLKTVFGSDGVLLEKPNIVSIFYLRQLLLLNSKLVKEPSKEEERTAARAFSERQSTLRKIVVPKDNPVLWIAQAILGKVLAKLDLSKIRPGHGPGVVHEGRDQDEKWDFTYWPSQANRVYPFYEYGVQSLEHLKEKSNSVVFLDKFTTKVCLVPKDFRGPRLISAEMSAMQYLQQGQMERMMAYIDSHPVLRLSIRLRDQTFNQDAARRAWEERKATLDLSDASDLLSASCVWYLLSKVPHVRKYLFRTRAHSASFEGALTRIVAFAPMGSATCFPVETLMFWAISLASLHLHRYGRRIPSFRTMSELGTEVKVFGDDIVIPVDCLQTCVSALQSVGCKPNMSKTCWETPFRESCGTEWFAGSSVSITRNKRYTYAPDNKFSHLPLLSDLQRRLCVAGLKRSAELVCQWAMQIAPMALLPSPTEWLDTDQLGSWQYLAYLVGRGADELPMHRKDDVRRAHALISRSDSCLFADVGVYPPGLRLRWNPILHRCEFRTVRYFQKSRGWRLEGYPRLLARLLSDLSDRVASRNLSVRKAWQPLPPGSWSFMTSNRRK